MKRFLSLIFTVIFILSISVVPVFADETETAEAFAATEAAQTAPLGTSDIYLINNEGLITESTAAEINRLCSGLYVCNKCKICMYVVNSFGAETPSDCADRIYSENISKGDEDFGLVFVCSISEGNYHLKCGSGLDGQFSDDEAKKILSESFEPLFSGGQYDNAFYALANELTNKLGNAIPHKTAGSGAGKVFLVILTVILVIVFLAVLAFLVLYIRAERIRRKRRMRNAQMRRNANNRMPQNRNPSQIRRQGRR